MIVSFFFFNLTIHSNRIFSVSHLFSLLFCFLLFARSSVVQSLIVYAISTEKQLIEIQVVGTGFQTL